MEPRLTLPENIAWEDSFREAVFMGIKIYRNREEHKTLTANPYNHWETNFIKEILKQVQLINLLYLAPPYFEEEVIKGVKMKELIEFTTFVGLR